MKLASLKAGQRDGQLIIVDRALKHCVAVPDIAPTLQAALDNWRELEPRLRAAAAALESTGPNPARPFEADIGGDVVPVLAAVAGDPKTAVVRACVQNIRIER